MCQNNENFSGHSKNVSNQTHWLASVFVYPVCMMLEVIGGNNSEACSTAHRSNRPDHWAGLC